MSMRFVVSTVTVGVTVLLLMGCSVSQEPTGGRVPKSWWVKDLAMFNRPRVTVTDEEEKPLGRFSTRTMRKLSQVKIGIADASGLYAELVIVEGRVPDAFSGFLASTVWGIPQGTPVIVMSVGLVQQLGGDMDAVAYLVGHEIAHLLKGHTRTRKIRKVSLQRIRVLTETGASNTTQPATDATLFAVTGVVARYTEAQEDEAHTAGLRYAMSAGYDKAGADRLLRILRAASSGEPAPFIERHPRDRGS